MADEQWPMNNGRIDVPGFEQFEKVGDFSLPAAGGTPVACGWITDHFGVSWRINPKMLLDMITDPDPIKVGKAMQAMMTMRHAPSGEIKLARS